MKSELEFQTIYYVMLDETASCEEGAVRLSSGTNESNGRVEICRHRTWGAVCSDDWDERDAEVVCRQLGFNPKGDMLVIFYVLYYDITPQMQLSLKQLRHQRKFQSLLAK